MHVIIGTAGHIDHGKTTLVKALTGVDADRLPEEKTRGITIDLGFAEMTVGETHFGFVDVPGHERFVRNMLAGASGIDILLLVIAADEGIMPQTREHFHICRLLGVSAGVIALTRSDLADGDTLDLAKLEVAELVADSFLENAPVIVCSSKTGDGMDLLKDALSDAARSVVRRGDPTVTRLPIDRSFSIKGFGTVVTGTLASGEIGVDSKLELMPQATPVRVRGVQTHGHATASAAAGQRTAVNLANIGHTAISRGMSLVAADTLRATQAIDAQVEVLADAPKPLRTRQRVRVHIGTAEMLARLHILEAGGDIAPGSRGLIQLRLEAPAVTVHGERFIIRSYSPQTTIAGGIVIDPRAERHRSRDLDKVRDFLSSVLDAADDVETIRLLIANSGRTGITIADLQAKTGLLKSAVMDAVNKPDIVAANGRMMVASSFESLKTDIITTLQTAHKTDPLAPGVTREALISSFRGIDGTVISFALDALAGENKIAVEKETVRLASHTSQLSPAESAFQQKLLDGYFKAGLEVPRYEEAVTSAMGGMTRPQADKLARLLIDAGKLVKVTDEFYFAREHIDATVAKIRESVEDTIDVPRFKERTGVSRKYAIPLLEYFDRTHVTARVGDKRVIIR